MPSLKLFALQRPNIRKCTSIPLFVFFCLASEFRFQVSIVNSSQCLNIYTISVLLDCVTPMVANLFYVLIALCFVIALTSSLSFIMNLLPPPSGFLQWLKRNTIFEMCNSTFFIFLTFRAILDAFFCSISRVLQSILETPSKSSYRCLMNDKCQIN